MAIPQGIERRHIEAAIEKFDAGAEHDKVAYVETFNQEGDFPYGIRFVFHGIAAAGAGRRALAATL